MRRRALNYSFLEEAEKTCAWKVNVHTLSKTAAAFFEKGFAMKIVRMILLHARCIFISLGWGLWSVLNEYECDRYRDENGPVLKIGNNWKK